MPKIPMFNKAGMINHRRSTVPMQGAPGMSWSMDDSRALINLGRSISDAGDKIGGAVNRTVSAREQFLARQQYTQDHLAATEAKNLYRTINAELEKRMAENPASFEEFDSWTADADRRYSEEVAKFTGKMSADFRKQFEADMKGVRIESSGRRRTVATQAKVTADYNLFQAQWKDAALRGDLNECNNLLDTHRNILISPQEYEQKKLDYNRMADFGAVKRLVEAGDTEIISKLKKRSGNGSYENFPALDVASRDKFIMAAEAMKTKKEAELDQKVLAALADGDMLYDDDALKQQHKSGLLSDRQYHTYKGWNEDLRTKKKRAADYQASQREKAEKASRRAQADKLLADVKFDSEGYIRKLDDIAFADARNKALNVCGNDYGLYTELLDKLNGLRNVDVSFRKLPVYNDGKSLINQMKAEGLFFADKNWSWSDDKSEDTQNLIERYMTMDLENYLSEHPDAKIADVEKYLRKNVEQYNKRTVEKIGQLAFSNIKAREGKRMVEERGENGVGRIRKTKDGRTAVWDGKGWKVKK